jgi:phage terminase large subunit-like protein
MVGCTSHTKRIPHEYLLATVADRIALLQGLMDTDGTCGKASGARQFYSVNRKLCEDVAYLARSLGLFASVKPKNGRYNGKGHLSWLTHIGNSSMSVFRLPRKKANERYADRRRRGLMIEAIELIGEAECTCITVEAADHLYITHDFLVTHNSIAGAYATTAHLTGLYPEWWPGRKFSRPIRAWVAGDTNETTRDIIQLELLGQVAEMGGGRKGLDGSGLIPRECIGQPKWKAGVADLVDTVPILHRTGGVSHLAFKSYDQGRKKFQGTSRELVWLDEECPPDVYDECRIRTMTTRGIVMLTFTPLQGLSETVLQFLPKEMRPGEV